MGFFRSRADGIELAVRLTPRAGTDAVECVTTASDGRDHLAAWVRAVPERGAANGALQVLLAGVFGVPRSAVSIAARATSRRKILWIKGDAERLAAVALTLAARGRRR